MILFNMCNDLKEKSGNDNDLMSVCGCISNNSTTSSTDKGTSTTWKVQMASEEKMK